MGRSPSGSHNTTTVYLVTRSLVPPIRTIRAIQPRHTRVTFWIPHQQWRRLIWSISAPSSFGNSVPSTAAISLTVKISKITKEKHILYFHLSHQNHAKNPRKQIRTVYELKSPGQRRRRKIHVLPPSPHFLATPLLTRVKTGSNISSTHSSHRSYPKFGNVYRYGGYTHWQW